MYVFFFSLKFVSISNITCVLCFFSFVAQKREIFQDLAPLLWHSACTIPALLQVLSPCLLLYFSHLFLYSSREIIYFLMASLHTAVFFNILTFAI